MLLDFPLDIQEEILFYCKKKDLKNLTICSRKYKEAVKPFLWQSFTLSSMQLHKEVKCS